MLRVGAILLGIVAALAVTGCGGAGEDGADASGRLVVLSDVAPVAKAFNADEGRPRLVLLLSPT